MIIELAKMGTGIMVRGGLGLLLRMLAFAAMSWATWHVAWRIGEPLWEWATRHCLEPLAAAIALIPVSGAIIALCAGTGGKQAGYSSRYEREPWGLWDFLRRVPFACWCLITDDGRDVPLWAILVWPAIIMSEVVLCIGTLVALPCVGLWAVIAFVGQVVWGVLSVRPLQRRSNR